MNAETIKAEIKKSYGKIAQSNLPATCCSTDTVCCTNSEINLSMSETYAGIEGYQQEADLSLGCGLPTESAGIKPGDTVLDLGSGAGNDVFIARRIVGDTGNVIGIDMTPEMVIRAWQNNHKLGYTNVAFHLGEIENMHPIPDHSVDVVISNCVMNLVPDKEKAFREVQRVLKAGGHFSISDIVYVGSLPKGILEAAALYAGCIAGASEKGAYLELVKAAGFIHIEVKKERPIVLPDELLLQYLSTAELEVYKMSRSGLFSITLNAHKPAEDCSGKETKTTVGAESACCGSETGTGAGCCA